MKALFLRNKRGGFTLIELLVVIAIIGILSSIVLASLNSARTKSRDTRRVSDIRQLQLALELYYDANTNKYPTSLSPLAPTYIAKVPVDPSSGTGYTYAAIGSGTACTSYHLGASLEDTANQALGSDLDATASSSMCTGSTDFSGLSAATGGAVCSSTAGTGQPGGTETCYDVSPL